ncbi:MAG: TRAP transporter small permease [Clostridia bacterium]|nr:TRAP transporter small permease [Clostridia bacterium]
MTKFVEKLSNIMDIGARAAVAGIMLVTTLNVILRMFGSSLKGSVEIVQYLNALGVGLGLALCAFHGGHVAVTFFIDKFSQKVQQIIGILIDVLVAGFLALTTWQLIIYGYEMQQSGEVALTTGLPIYPIVYLVVAGFVAFVFVVINGIVKTLVDLFTGKPVAVAKPEDNINVEDLISQ